MMEKLKLSDYSTIKPYLDMANYEGCNSNFVTMMMWNHEYHIQYEIHDHYMIMLHNYKGKYFWAMPFTTKEYYKEAIDYMIDYSYDHNFDFMIDCAVEEFVNDVRDIYKDELIFERIENSDDYIYDKQMHLSLSGKKMQKRRNHYNFFEKNYPQYVYKDLDNEKDFNTILDCLYRWENDKEKMSETIVSEIYGIMYLLSAKNLLNFEVGGIFIDNVMEAFIIASKINHNTVQIHVEKANKNIRGLYPAILKELLEHHFHEELYINREDDMGLDNLRKAKMSLHPIKMIKKYRVTLNKLYIDLANSTDKDQIINLWKSSFHDENDQTTDFYFYNLYKEENTYVLKNKDKVISTLQIVPMNIYNSKIEKCYFILGVCTDHNFQNQGCMKYLLNHVLKVYENKTIYLQAYVPEIYYKFGFSKSHYHQVIKLDKSILKEDNTLCVVDDLLLSNEYYERYTQSFNEYRIRDEEYWLLLKKRCICFNDEFVIFKNYGYMIYHQEDNKIYINEIIYLNENALYHMLNYFYSNECIIEIECDMNVCIPGERKIIATMLSNGDNTKDIDSLKYINEIY